MELQFLYELQQQENNLKKLMAKISDSSGETQTNRLKDEYTRLKDEYVVLCAKKSDAEAQVTKKKSHKKILEDSKASYEKLIYTPEINSVKKFETLEKQIDEAQKNIEFDIHNIENLQKYCVDIDTQISGIKKKLVFIKKKHEVMKANKKEEIDFLNKEKENIEELIVDIKKNIAGDLYAEYTEMKQRLSDPISKIEERKCSGCGMEVPILDYEAVKSGNSLKCQNCGRILMYKKNI